MRKILFLDIDGCLNSKQFEQYKRSQIKKGYLIPDFPLSQYDLRAVNNLNMIIEQTDCDIVLSSDWRFSKGIYETLRKAGLCKDPIGITPCLGSYPVRGKEIGSYLAKCAIDGMRIDRYVIIDDDFHDGLFPADSFVHVNGNVGLALKDVERAVEILNS